eukprot:m51a1_g10609 hypothetical protein (398) ;mRNA; f:43917-45733
MALLKIARRPAVSAASLRAGAPAPAPLPSSTSAEEPPKRPAEAELPGPDAKRVRSDPQTEARAPALSGFIDAILHEETIEMPGVSSSAHLEATIKCLEELANTWLASKEPYPVDLDDLWPLLGYTQKGHAAPIKEIGKRANIALFNTVKRSILRQPMPDQPPSPSAVGVPAGPVGVPEGTVTKWAMEMELKKTDLEKERIAAELRNTELTVSLKKAELEVDLRKSQMEASLRKTEMETSLRKAELEARVRLSELQVEKIRAAKEAAAEAPRKPLVYLTTFLLSKGHRAGTAGKLEVEFYQDVHNLVRVEDFIPVDPRRDTVGMGCEDMTPEAAREHRRRVYSCCADHPQRTGLRGPGCQQRTVLPQDAEDAISTNRSLRTMLVIVSGLLITALLMGL